MNDANITLAVLGIGLTLFFYGFDKFFDLIQNMITNKPLENIVFFKGFFGLMSLSVAFWIFTLLGIFSSTQFLLILFLFAIIMAVTPLALEINRIRKFRNKPL